MRRTQKLSVLVAVNEKNTPARRCEWGMIASFIASSWRGSLVIEQPLDGRSSPLKECTIGSEVFGKRLFDPRLEPHDVITLAGKATII